MCLVSDRCKLALKSPATEPGIAPISALSDVPKSLPRYLKQISRIKILTKTVPQYLTIESDDHMGYKMLALSLADRHKISSSRTALNFRRSTSFLTLRFGKG